MDYFELILRILNPAKLQFWGLTSIICVIAGQIVLFAVIIIIFLIAYEDLENEKKVEKKEE